MQQSTKNQWPILKSQDTHLETWMDAFLLDRKAQGMSKGTLYFYQKKLELFAKFCDGQIISQITQITPQTIR